jgi:N utilization substance protein B
VSRSPPTGDDPPSSDRPVRRPTARSPRRRARELAVQGLYQWRVGGQDASACESFLAADPDFERADQALFRSLLQGTIAASAALTDALAPHLDRPFAELSPVEAAILLLAAHELSAHPETPYRVIINEAIELAKTFGGTDGHKYVNGVLDRLAARLRPGEATASR